jgi:signal transduction histidine kinase
MQTEENNIILIVVVITCIFFGAAFFMLLYINAFMKRKKKHLEEKQKMLQSFEQALSQSQLEIQEHTFNAISQEIHDNVGQILSLAKVQLNIVEDQMENAHPLLLESKTNISRAMTDLRDIAKSLNSDRIEKISLVQAIEQEVEHLNKTNIIHALVRVGGEEKYIDGKKKLIVFRIIQEALNNALKHADAMIIKIMITYHTELVKIAIEDNGKGFDISNEHNNGLGLQNIIKRTALMGGEAVIQSEVSKGTIITLSIPYS